MLAQSVAHVRARSNDPRRESGASAVEFALVLPILLMLLMGVTTGSLAYADHLAVQNAVREGSRLGAAIDYSTAPTTPTIWANSVQTRVQQVYFNAGSTLPTANICVKLYKDDGTTVLGSPSAPGTQCGTEPPNPSNIPSGSCFVKVWAGKTRLIKLGVFPSFTSTLRARSVAYYGRTAGSCAAF